MLSQAGSARPKASLGRQHRLPSADHSHELGRRHGDSVMVYRVQLKPQRSTSRSQCAFERTSAAIPCATAHLWRCSMLLYCHQRLARSAQRDFRPRQAHTGASRLTEHPEGIHSEVANLVGNPRRDSDSSGTPAHRVGSLPRHGGAREPLRRRQCGRADQKGDLWRRHRRSRSSFRSGTARSTWEVRSIACSGKHTATSN
jgi:hypothetical protein